MLTQLPTFHPKSLIKKSNFANEAQVRNVYMFARWCVSMCVCALLQDAFSINVIKCEQ